MQGLDPESLVAALKAAAEPTRLRILFLLADGQLNVTDLTRILGQSQPRISRHLKLLAEAAVVQRFREGSWVYFELAEALPAGRLARQLIALSDASHPLISRDRVRAEALKREHFDAAQAYFAEHAAQWDQVRSLHIAEADVERAIIEALGPGPFELLVDLGTGTGRMLELLAPCYNRAIGIDANHAMLGYARAKLDRLGLKRAQVRYGDLYGLPLDDGVAGAVVMHQVLHYLRDPQRALAEAARVLAPGGQLLLVDFAPHELDFMRERHAHVRLGFSTAQLEPWLRDAGLVPLGSRRLEPTSGAGATGGDKLTVEVWRAERPGITSANLDDETLEAARG